MKELSQKMTELKEVKREKRKWNGEKRSKLEQYKKGKERQIEQEIRN